MTDPITALRLCLDALEHPDRHGPDVTRATAIARARETIDALSSPPPAPADVQPETALMIEIAAMAYRQACLAANPAIPEWRHASERDRERDQQHVANLISVYDGSYPLGPADRAAVDLAHIFTANKRAV